MASPLVERLLGNARGWDRPAGAIAGGVNAICRAARPVQGLLNGTWLGHPLHPLATDVVIGAWTVALVFDLIGLAIPGSGLASAAALALWLGVLAALVSVLSGATDRKDTYGLKQRVGFVHGLLMFLVTLLYMASRIVRLAGPIDSAPARPLGIAGSSGSWRAATSAARWRSASARWSTTMPFATRSENSPRSARSPN